MHHEPAGDEVAAVDEQTLGVRRVGEHHVRVAAASQLEGLAAADGNDLHAITGLPLEDGKQGVQQPGIPGRGGGGEENLTRLGRSRR